MFWVQIYQSARVGNFPARAFGMVVVQRSRPRRRLRWRAFSSARWRACSANAWRQALVARTLRRILSQTSSSCRSALIWRVSSARCSAVPGGGTLCRSSWAQSTRSLQRASICAVSSRRWASTSSVVWKSRSKQRCISSSVRSTLRQIASISGQLMDARGFGLTCTLYRK